MAKIRGTHSSAGVYIAYTGVKYANTKKERKEVAALVSTSPGGGGGEPVNPVLWVFGDKFPVVFS